MKKIDLYLEVPSSKEASEKFDSVVNALKKSGIATSYVSFLDFEWVEKEGLPHKQINGHCIGFDYDEKDEAAIKAIFEQCGWNLQDEANA